VNLRAFHPLKDAMNIFRVFAAQHIHKEQNLCIIDFQYWKQRN